MTQVRAAAAPASSARRRIHGCDGQSTRRWWSGPAGERCRDSGATVLPPEAFTASGATGNPPDRRSKGQHARLTWRRGTRIDPAIGQASHGADARADFRRVQWEALACRHREVREPVSERIAACRASVHLERARSAGVGGRAPGGHGLKSEGLSHEPVTSASCGMSPSAWLHGSRLIAAGTG